MRELARLALTLKRIEGTDKLRLERERTTAKPAPVGGTKPQGGLSPGTAAAIREVVEGRPGPPDRALTSVPVDAWVPAGSRPSSLIPPDPVQKFAVRSGRRAGVRRNSAASPDQASGSR